MENSELVKEIQGATTVLRDAAEKCNAIEARLDAIELKFGHQNIVKPGDPWSGERQKQNKGICLSDGDKSFLRFLRKGEAALGPSERKALVEDATGQYLVSPAIDTEISRSLDKLVIMRQLASGRQIDKDRIQVRDIDEATVAWGKIESTASISESSLTPGAPAYHYVEDLYGLTKIGEDELADSDFNLVNVIADSFSRAIAEKENLAFLTGRGHTTYEEPDGITVDATLVAAAKTTTAAGSVTIEDFLQCIYEVPAKYRAGSAWIVNSLTELELRKLRSGGYTASDGPFLWQPAVAQGAPNTFLGYPIYNQDDGIADLSGTEGVIAIFGNFQMGYRILERKGVTIQRLNELYAEAGLIGFKVHARVGGYLLRPANKALVLLKEHSA